MINSFKGYITTIIGALLMVFALLDYTGIISVAAPEGVTELEQVAYAAGIGLALFFTPPTKIEEKINQLIDKWFSK